MPKGVYPRKQRVKVGRLVTPLQDGLISRLYQNLHMSMGEIAEDLGVSRKVVRVSLKRTETPSRSRANYGPKNGSWRGGRLIDEDGYVQIRIGGKYVPEHRLVMEQHLKRPLLPSEVVHHRNKNKQDNSLGNLVLFPDNATHPAFELTGHVPQWTEDGLRRMSEGVRRIPSRKGIPMIRTGRADAHRLRRTLISQYELETSPQGNTEPAVVQVQLPPLPPRLATSRETESNQTISDERSSEIDQLDHK